MRTILYFSGIALLCFALNACSDTKTENTTKVAVVPKLNHKPPVKEEANVPVDYSLLDSLVSDNIIKLDSIYGHTPYYVKTQNTYLFYVCGKKLEYDNEGKYNPTSVLLGIADYNCNELLKPQYTKIYNPDATAVGYIEIENNGKRGLFNYKTYQIIPPSFDVIFPSDQPGIDAFGKQGDLYVAIINGTIAPYQGNIPTYISYWQKWKFDIKNKSIKHLLDSYETYYSGDPEYGQGVVFTPSYLFALGFLSEVVTGIDESPEVSFGTLENQGKLIEEHSITDNIMAFISSFYEEGADGRGWQIDQKSLVTVDKKNNILGKQLILERSDYDMQQYCSENYRGYRFLDNNILEVYDVLYNKDKYEEYSHMTVYSYYKIEQNGSVKELKSNRSFDFTKFIKINESHLKGLFYKDKSDAERADANDGSNMWASECLSIEDLDVMRNEIYAEYGLVFKTPKWQEYFSKKDWYRPRYENVDTYLSEIDKTNLKVILALRNKMVGNENKFTQKHGFTFSAAG